MFIRGDTGSVSLHQLVPTPPRLGQMAVLMRQICSAGLYGRQWLGMHTRQGMNLRATISYVSCPSKKRFISDFRMSSFQSSLPSARIFDEVEPVSMVSSSCRLFICVLHKPVTMIAFASSPPIWVVRWMISNPLFLHVSLWADVVHETPISWYPLNIITSSLCQFRNKRGLMHF